MTDMIGCLYIDGNPLCNVSGFETEVDTDECTRNEVTKLHDINMQNEITFTCPVQWNLIAWWKVIGLWDWAIRNCPNKRVVYLMNHGKTRRVRLKNFRRAIRIVAKILNNV